jgi:hypothetical protein
MEITYRFDKEGHGAVDAFTVEYSLCLVLVFALYINGRG